MPPEEPSGTWAPSLFARLAIPRRAGSSSVHEVEEEVADRLRAMGYAIVWQTFATSPARLYAASLGVTGLGWTALALTPLFVLAVPAWLVTLSAFAAIAAVATLAAGVAGGYLPLGGAPVEARNLIATRTANPSCWLVAHSDSKAQRLSLRGRVVAFAALLVGLGALAVLLGLRWAGPLPLAAVVPSLAVILGAAAMLGGPQLVGESAGAVDNASGIVAALVAAERLNRPDVGVLITGAEEFGMEGARAWVLDRSESAPFVNFDGIDAAGRFNVMQHVPAGGATPPIAAAQIQREVARALSDDGFSVRPKPLPLGVFVDGAVLASAGLPGVTVSRGDWETLGVIHTPADTADRTNVEGAVAGGRAAATALATLLG